MKYKLHTGIKTVIDANGKEVLSSVLLSNILADYGVFDEYPTTKIVLKDLLTKGYGKKIVDGLSKVSNPSKAIIESTKKEFEKNSNYKKDIVAYVFESIAFGLGLITSVTEPFSSGFDPYASESDGILDRLPDMLAELKKEYTDSLEKLLVKPKDLVWDAPAYYTAESENELYLIEGKIAIISKQLGDTNSNWCKMQKDSKLYVYLTRKRGAVKELLDSKKIEYKDTITKAFNEPSSVGTGKSICFDNSKLEIIKSLEETIVSLYREEGETYDKWCENQKAVLINSSLDRAKNNYKETISKALIVPHSRIISRAAYLDPSFDKEIEDKEHLIIALYKEMGTNYDGWCENEKNQLLKPYLVSRAKQIRQAILKVLLPLVVIISGTIQFVAYNSSTDEIARYESTISQADTYMSQGKYGQALGKYLSAGDNYAGSYNPSSYKSESVDKANTCFENLKNAVEQQMQSKKYKTIQNELASIPQSYLASDAQKKDWVDKTNTQLKQMVDNEIETLINKIAIGNGHLDADGKKFLDELLSVSPDNYWFKIIKSKEQ